MKRFSISKGFTLIELLVVISIIALLSSVIVAAISKSRIKARDSARIQNARQLAIALEQYEQANNTYKISNSGLNNGGDGFAAKGSESAGYTNSIISTLKSAGFYSSNKLIDPIFGTDNYYIGLCTSTNAYNVFVKLEQSEYNNATSSITSSCGGSEASALGFSFIASTAGGSSGGGGTTSGYGSQGGGGIVCGVSTVTGPDTITYGTVLGADGKCWLDRNLGATRVATAATDNQAYGHYYQWGRGVDGHQIKLSATTSVLSTSDVVGNSSFITGASDWRSPKNDGLWQIGTNINNPCPSGFHVPQVTEWSNLLTSANITNSATAFSSTLKLTMTGARTGSLATYYSVGSSGIYWTSDINGSDSKYFTFDASATHLPYTNFRNYGKAIRCVAN